MPVVSQLAGRLLWARSGRFCARGPSRREHSSLGTTPNASLAEENRGLVASELCKCAKVSTKDAQPATRPQLEHDVVVA